VSDILCHLPGCRSLTKDAHISASDPTTSHGPYSRVGVLVLTARWIVPIMALNLAEFSRCAWHAG
jgi:hypothetical protein